ncbi:MAG: precorrin-6y C5,15-methyltransferase (decarboxylating) subunit CbiE [Megasphaera sp.]|jgi:precorrin-6Y C5,15-methyltransferase (decarboxylating)|nr:precorrin-6y C5,15-methyltransferase (decarboxylating) subunit CbiE [Megasphaera sp.]
MKVYIIGMGPGNPQLLTTQARQALSESRLIIGDKRMMQAVQTGGKETHLTSRPSEIKAVLSQSLAACAAVIVSGDVGFFSLAASLREIPGCTVQLICGISSLVYFAARLSMTWQDACVVSRHGRSQPLVSVVFSHPKVFCLTGGTHSVAAICRELCTAGLGEVHVFAGENLSYEDERIEEGTAASMQQSTLGDPSVLMILNDRAQVLQRPVHGWDDDLFLRGNVPMTKQEIRAVAISKLQPQPEDIVYDIGAGTGSCTVEMAMQVPFGHVYACECNEEALALTAKNIERFGTANVTVIAGKAPAALASLPRPDAVFIGGTRGNMAAILDSIYHKNPACRIVMTAVTLETLAAITSYYTLHQGYAVDITQISAAVSQTVGPYHMMKGRNPIYIIRALREADHGSV